MFAVRCSLFALLVVMAAGDVFAQAPPKIYDLTCTAPPQFNPVVEVDECFLNIWLQINTTPIPVNPTATLTPTFTTPPPPAPPGTQMYSKHVGAVQITNPTPNRYYWVKAYYYDNSGNGVKNYVTVTQTLRP